MGEVFITRRLVGDSGAKRARAVINVLYPQGSTCTCAAGNKLFKAPNSLGACSFYLPFDGRWRVACSDADRERSADIDVDSTVKTLHSLRLSYGLYLYDRGEEAEGLQMSLRGAVKNSGGISCTSYMNPDTAQHTFSSVQLGPLELGGYSSFKVRFKPLSSTAPSTARFIINATSNPAAQSFLNRPARSQWQWDAAEHNKELELSLDIGQFGAGSSLAAGVAPGGVSSAEICEMWLE